ETPIGPTRIGRRSTGGGQLLSTKRATYRAGNVDCMYAVVGSSWCGSRKRVSAGSENRMDWPSFREPVSAWTHLLWLLLAVPGTWLLWRRSREDRPKQISLLVFGLSLGICFAGSSLYHGLQVSDERIRLLEVLDFAGIYLLIAGTYTPVVFTLLLGRWKWTVLLTVWSLSALGSGLRIIYYDIPPWLYTSLYLAMGWGAVFCYAEIARQLSHRVLAPILVGGLLYSVGAVLNLVHWPVLWPQAVEADAV